MSLPATMTLLTQCQWLDHKTPLPQVSGVDWEFLGKGQTPPAAVVHCHQVHGTDIAVERFGLEVKADGLLTTQRGITLGIKTADCLPVLFAHPRTVAAVHAGWRGLTAGILQQATKQLTRELGDLYAVHAVIGPSIGIEAFEVGPEVVDALVRCSIVLNEMELASVLMKGKRDRWHIDLQTAAALQLIKLGVRAENIAIVRECTLSATERWSSHRRDGKNAGRNWAIVSRGLE